MEKRIHTAIRPLLVVAGFLFWARVVSGAIIVNTASDTINPTCGTTGGTCSLRDAIILSQGDHGWSIHFAIGTGHQTITLMTNLPDIITQGGIDGTTQPGFSGVPLIEIHRADAGSATRGLHLGQPPIVAEGGVTVRSLVINHFSGICADCGGIIIDNDGGNFFRGNYIGTDATGMTADGNSIAIRDNSFGANQYGGLLVSDRNVISGNANGIQITNTQGGFTVKDIIQGNYFGLNALGTGEVHNVGGAIFVSPPAPGFSPGILIGGPDPGAGNVFAGVGGSGQGIDLASAGDPNATNNVIQGNIIGLDKTGLVSLPIENGIVLEGEIVTKILGNVISVTGDAIRLLFSGTDTNGVIVQGNYIGTDATGNHVLASGVNGINFSGGQNNTIGGSAAGQGNVIGGFQFGIFVGGAASTGNVIKGNRIGIAVNGSPIPNTRAGIYVNGSGSTTIGGINPGEGNIIAFNGPSGAVPGISVVNTTHNTISGNSIHGNSGLGIDLSVGTIADGVTPNDPCDPDTGPNDLQNFPVITAVTPGSSTRIQGTLNSKAGFIYRLQFFANASCHPSGHGEGQAFIGYFDLVAPGCDTTFDVSYLFATTDGQFVTATATDPSGNTSEFSACFMVTAPPAPNRVFVSARTGNDANNCASILTPCQTLAGAAAQVAGFGEVIILDSGGYGPVTITRAVTIEAPPGVLAFIHPSSGDAITVNAGVSDTVVLRGLVLNGGTANGITVNTAGALHVENCVIGGFLNGLSMLGPGQLFVKDTIARGNTMTGLNMAVASGTATASIDRCRFESNGVGLMAGAASKASVRRSVASGNASGLVANGTGAELDIDACLVANNGTTGIAAGSSGGTVRLSRSTVTDNTLGLHQSGSGTLLSRTDNTVEGNTTNTSGTIGSYVAK